MKDKNPKTADEVRKILDYESISNKDLADILNRTRYNSLGEYSAWNHVDSRYVIFGNHKRQEIEHRLYINCDSSYTHLILYEFIKRCHQNKITYYFKYDIYGDRDDTIVFYSLGNFLSAQLNDQNYNKMIGLMSSLTINKTKIGDDVTITIDNIDNDLIFNYYQGYRNFKVKGVFFSLLLAGTGGMVYSRSNKICV